ncbi:aspartyl protease family protein [Actinomadura harenae]|nr:aspartyl protease family protein [Actinomadura harenae]
MSPPDDHGRRRFLQRTGLAAAAFPLIGGRTSPAATSPTRNTAGTSGDDPDRLFRDGRFAEAEHAYRRALRADPKDAHAAARLGYIALLSNRFGTAERWLSGAIELNPKDADSKRRLAECLVRQDRHAQAIPILEGVGTPLAKASATQYRHLDGAPYRISGPSGTRVPFTFTDPLPVVEASVNGSAPKRFLVDTYATLDLSPDAAKELGLTAYASVPGVAGGAPTTIHLGVLDSLRIGDIEVRNLPVQWTEGPPRPTLPDGTLPDGVFGTTLMYHFLTTMDYARRGLVLRRREDAPRSGGLPLWLAGDHFPCSVGGLNGGRPRMVTLDTGGIGHGLDTTVEIAERLGIAVDRDHPVSSRNGIDVYPCRPDRMSLGRATGRHVLGFAAERVFPGLPGPGLSALTGFDLIANFTHDFFKPYAVTFDYTSMRLRLTRPR